ncbi:MAG: pyridoxal-dependent decarboxylase [Peptostreptococcaceae bacterium]|nr:pyridoxal-dependent decarboxylase [Peptostreptococcaceae bacterium]
MQINYQEIKGISEIVGDSFYILDIEQFGKNYQELKSAFCKYYPKFNIAYSYKTNYIPKLCKLVDDLGGLAEVVSSMEYELALRVGVRPQNIIFNGPYKKSLDMEKLLLAGGTVNIDSLYETSLLKEIAARNPGEKLNIGIRLNFEVGDGVVSRFGFDVDGEELADVIESCKEFDNIHIKGVHCHIANRSLAVWKNKVSGMLAAIKKLFMDQKPEFISMGGGLYGKMAESLKKQFNTPIPDYEEYAQLIAKGFADFYQGYDEDAKPELLIEPGSALVGDVMHFVTKVLNIKDVRGKKIATLTGSIYNINPTLNTKNPPIRVLSDNTEQCYFKDLDFGGYTCIESDYLYRNFEGMLSVGDHVVFSNVGSYSIVLKPPFILPNFPILEMGSTVDNIEYVKDGEDMSYIFQTYHFE